jgi:hypothetical protein
MVVRDEDARRAIKTRRWFEGVPLLVIEVDYTKRVVRVHTLDTDK